MGSWKLEKDLRRGELPGLLRRLADVLETGRAGGDFSGMPGDPRKLVLVTEDRPEGQRVKLKAKRAGEVLTRAAKPEPIEPIEPAQPAARPAPPKRQAGDGRAREKYRQLKKALQADYKALSRAAAAGAQPGQELVESFIGLCQAMADMEQAIAGSAGGPEAGELARASRACAEEALALRGARDPGRLADILARLERRKAACHAQFK